ncbi:cation:proton antiporter [Candidatus Laterigemmans baculatus]|uniref:cation:proton antiporter n=1 Tax=Candidatus Laterigemmans baculatus TaxID=2770505 RepID=UPI0013DC5E6D|nr:cation:proton antiporter [Candidatus Laterigemmans baculatus]
MTTVTLILAAAAVGFGLATWWRLPAVPLLILIGLGLRLFDVFPSQPTLHNALLLGVTFLVFFVGTELDVKRVGGQRRAALAVGVAHVTVLGSCGLLAAILLRFDGLAAVYLAVAVTASSTLSVVTLLRQRQQAFEPFARLVIGILLLQDVLVIFMLPVLTRATEGWGAIAGGVAATLALMGLAGICIRWVSPWLLLRLNLDEESSLLAVLAILFTFAGLAHQMGLPLVSGAFLAGVSLSGFPVSGVVRGQLSSLADFFLAVFFVALGASVSIPSLQHLLLEGLLLSGVLLVTPPIVMLLVRKAGFTARASIETAHLLAQCGEFSLVVALLGIERGHIGANVLAVIVLMVVVTTTAMPLLTHEAVTWQLMRRLPGKRRKTPAVRPRDHVLLLGCGRHMREVLDNLLTEQQQLVVVDEDAGVIAEMQERGLTAVRGDGADYRVLRRVGAREARVILSTMRRLRDHERLLHFVSGPKVLVRVFEPAEAERCEALGATVVVEAEAAAREFDAWFAAQTWNEAQPPVAQSS